MKKSLVCASLLLALSLTACSAPGLNTAVKGSGIVTKGRELPDKSEAVTLSTGEFGEPSYTELASNGSFRLLYDSENCAVRLTDIAGAGVWDSTIDTAGARLSSAWKQNVSSMFEINYSHPNENGRERIVSASVRKLNSMVWSEPREGGVDIQYYFTDRKLGFTAEFRLTDTGFSVNIPAKSIIENGEYRFVSINILPYFSAAGADESGFVLSSLSGGALLDFSGASQGKYIQLPVYSENNPKPEKSYKLDAQATQHIFTDTNVCTMPVVGMRAGDRGFVAYADSTGEDSYINISTAYYGIPYSRVSFCCYIRNVTTLSFSGGTDSDDGTADILDDDIIPTDKKICFDLLYGNDLDYNVMASAYRTHLLEKGLISENKKSLADVSVEILMGVPRKEIAGTTLVKTATFAEAQEIVKQLHEKGIENALINLKGWNSGGCGASPTESSAASALGGKSGLEKLAAYCKEIGYTLLLETDYITLNTDFSSVSAKKASAVDSNGFYVNDTDEKIYYQRLSEIQKDTQGLIKEFSASGIAGASFCDFGNLIYKDYHGTVTYSSDFSEGLRDILKSVKDTFTSAAVRGGNLCVLKDSDYAYDTAVPFSGSITYSAFVPFVQLVLGRSVGLMTEPVNSFYNPTLQELMLLEYGSIPDYELTYDSVYSLQSTDYNTLFSAKSELWLDSISAQYDLRTKTLGDIRGLAMSSHRILANGAVLITYENGKRLLINKSANEIDYEGTSVKAYGFALLD